VRERERDIASLCVCMCVCVCWMHMYMNVFTWLLSVCVHTHSPPASFYIIFKCTLTLHSQYIHYVHTCCMYI